MKRISIALVIVVSLIGAVVGLGASYPGKFTPVDDFSLFDGFGHDGWLVDEATLKLADLPSTGNHLELTFNPWRPDIAGDAVLDITVCGEKRAAFVVTDERVWKIDISGSCEPRKVVFDFRNPFVPSTSDNRQLGVQLQVAQVSSQLGVPIVNPLYSAFFWVFFSLIGIMLVSAIENVALATIAGIGFPVFCTVILTTSSWVYDGINVLSLLISLGLLIVGFFLAALHPRKAEGRFESLGFDREPGYTPELTWVMVAVVSGVLLLALILRTYGISFGLPAPFHPDETPKFNAIYGMRMRGDLNPHYFLHPSLLLYSANAVSRVLEWLSISSNPQESIRLGGRLISACAGTLSVGLVYFIARRLFSPFVGLISALLLAVNPLHVTCSRYMKEDVLMLFMFLLTLLLVVKAVQQKKHGFLFMAGLTAGMCFGSKYSGLLAVVPLVAAPWLRSRSLKPDEEYAIYVLGALCLVPLGFVLTTPYSVLDFQGFQSGIMSEKRHMLRGHTVPIDAWSQYWMYHLWRSLIPGTTTVTLMLSLLGMGVLIWRRKPHDLFIVGLVLLYYLPAEWVKAKPAPQAERYMVPVVAFLGIACAEFIRVLGNTRVRPLLPLLIAVAVGAPLVRTIYLATEVVNDTRTRMADWMVENLPQGARVAIDYPPYDPPFLNGEFEVVRFAPGKLITRLSEGDLGEHVDYLVLSSLVYDRFFSQPNGSAGRREVIRNTFKTLPIVHQEEPYSETYGFHNPTLTVFALQPSAKAKLREELREVAEGRRDKTSNEIRASFKVQVPSIR